jgi:hypothetical protein
MARWLLVQVTIGEHGWRFDHDTHHSCWQSLSYDSSTSHRQGRSARGSQGTMLNEVDNLGRVLVVVHWDQEFVVPVFPHEIEFTTQQEEVRH